VPEEMRFLLRGGGYGLGVGSIYYALSREAAGAMLLIGFGLAALVLLAASWWQWRRQPGRRLRGPAWRWLLMPPAEENGGFTDELARLPGRSLAPLTIGLGLALVALALVFGLWLLAAAVLPLLVGLRAWLIEAMGEFRALSAGVPADQPAEAVVNRR
jgi:hypothetical protein